MPSAGQRGARFGALILAALCLFTTVAPADDTRVRAALDWLAPRLTSEAWTRVPVVRANEAAKRSFTESMAAYVLSLFPEVKSLSGLRRLLDKRLTARVRRGHPVFAGWLLGAESLYFAEWSARAGRAHPALGALASRIADLQNAEGGWGHGSDVSMDIYPTTLMATTWWALLGLGAARRFGVEIEDGVIDRGVSLMRDVQTTSGGIPYGGRPYRRGVEAGRTAGAVLALAALGESEHPAAVRAADYLLSNLTSVRDGHASPAMHLAVGAHAVRLLGEVARDAYDRVVLTELRRVQRKDGSFNDLLGSSPDSFELMGSEETNRAYITALYAAALAAPRSRFLSLLHPVPVTSRSPAASPPAPEPTWTLECGSLVDVALDQSRGAALSSDGKVTFFDVSTGTRLGRVEVGDAGAIQFAAGTCLVWKPMRHDGAPRSLVAAETARSRCCLRAVEPGRVCWSQRLSHPIRFVSEFRGAIAVQPAGCLLILRPEDGEVRFELSLHAPLFSSRACALGPECLVYAGGVLVRALDRGGFERWRCRSRGKRGVNASPWLAVTAANDAVFAGRADGRLERLHPKTGKRLLRTELGSSIEQLIPAGAARLLAVTADGRLHCLESGELKPGWTADVTGGRAELRGPRIRVAGSLVWAGSVQARRLTAFELGSGRERLAFRRERSAVWDAVPGVLVTRESDGALAGFRIPD
jgi:hypothetical protein